MFTILKDIQKFKDYINSLYRLDREIVRQTEANFLECVKVLDTLKSKMASGPLASS